MSEYLDTETNTVVQATQYFGLNGPVFFEGALIYVNDTDWLILYPNGKVTAFINAAFLARFTSV